VRNGKNEKISVTIGTLPDAERPVKAARKGSDETPENNRLNVVISELSQAQKDKWNIRNGVVIQSVLPGAGANAGLVSGDVITMLNGERVESIRQFVELVNKLPEKKSVPMRIVRRGSPLFIPLRLGDE